MSAGYAWTEQLELEARQGVRSVLRGIGPSRQSASFDLMLMWDASPDLHSDISGAPALFTSASVVGCFWILREIELVHIRQCDVIMDRERLQATLQLSVSKTDPVALGCARTWGCVCGSQLDTPCGYLAVDAAVHWNL